MTPEELEQQNIEQQGEIDELKRFVADMSANATLPHGVGDAIVERVGGREIIEDTTTKSLTSEQHAGGAAGLKNPEFWLEVRTRKGLKYFVAAYQ